MTLKLEPPAKKSKIDSWQTREEHFFADLCNSSDASGPVLNEVEVDAYLNNSKSGGEKLEA